MTTNYIVKFKVLENNKTVGAWYILSPCKNKKDAELLKQKTIKNCGIGLTVTREMV